MSFENKVAVVTGGGSGIGRGISERYANEGAKVIIAGRRENVLKEVADSNKNISYVVADITNSDDVAKIVKTVETDFSTGSSHDLLAVQEYLYNMLPTFFDKTN